MPKHWQLCYSLFFLSLMLISCEESKREYGKVLFEEQCSSCHLLPAIDALPKSLWEEKVLPEMAARMGIKEGDYNPVKDFSYEELLAVNEAKIYGQEPLLSDRDWERLKNYILQQAPDSISVIEDQKVLGDLPGFSPVPVALNNVRGSRITFLRYDTLQEKLLIGDMRGHLLSYDHVTQKSENLILLGNPVPDFHIEGEDLIVTAIGRLNPSEQALGKVFRFREGVRSIITENLHRPVHTLLQDLNKDGKKELVVSEFGDLTGKLSLFTLGDSAAFSQKILSHVPGSMRSVARDMNGDGVDDLIALAAQGDEGITIFYQEGDLSFREEKVIRFSPLSGLSWFEIIDFDGDGDDDILTVHGDNADKTYVHKSYHGLRIHLNDGSNHFEEKFVYPMYGVTRSVSRDFDQDGDLDIALIATFPNYERTPLSNFIYLENKDAATFTFEASTFSETKLGRWFLIEAADVDKDGDEDIVLSSFTYTFTPVPEEFTKRWQEENIDLMILENDLNK